MGRGQIDWAKERLNNTRPFLLQGYGLAFVPYVQYTFHFYEKFLNDVKPNYTSRRFCES